MQLTAILAIVAVIGPFLAWGATDLKAKWIDIPNARAEAARVATAKEHALGITACNERVEGIRKQVAAASEEAQKLAMEAANTIGPTPAEKTALQSVCNASSSCRDRKQGD